MSQNLSLNLNNSGLSKPQTSAHAQNFSTAKLQRRKEIESAKTSVGKAFSANKNNGPLSSISRIVQNNKSTSVNQNGVNIEDDDQNIRDEIRDRLRSQHIKQLMKDKKDNPDKYKK